MLRAKQFVVCLLAFAVVAQGQGNTFNKVRYNGGTVSTKVDPKDWNNTLTVAADLITFKLKDGQKIEILPKSVTTLSYGQEAHRRVGTMIGLALISPVALFGLFHKTRLHFIGVQYKTADGKKAGLLLQGDKDNYRAIIVALQSVTGVPVSVGEKEKEYIPVGVTTTVTKETGEQKETPEPTATGAAASRQTGAPETPASITVTSDPGGADIYADDAFVGNAPATLKLKPGKHTIRVAMKGYKDWSREITVQSGSEVQLNATLEKQE